MSELACEAIVLDLGGVLIDVQFDNAISYWHQCAGLPQTSADDIHYQPGIAYEQHERGEIGFPEFANSLREQLNFELDLEQWRQGWNASLGNTISGAHDLIRQIAHDRPVYLFSNSNATHFRHWRELHHELLLPMRDVFVSHELGMRKPDPEAYRAIACLPVGFFPCLGQSFFSENRDRFLDIPIGFLEGVLMGFINVVGLAVTRPRAFVHDILIPGPELDADAIYLGLGVSRLANLKLSSGRWPVRRQSLRTSVLHFSALPPDH